MTTLSRDLLKQLRKEIDCAVAAVAARHGLDGLATGACTFDPTGGSFTFKLEGKVAGGKSKEATRYETNSWLGLPALGTEFTSAGRKYRTAGLNTTGTKVICTRDDGKAFLFKTEAVVRLCGGAVKHAGFDPVAPPSKDAVLGMLADLDARGQ